MSLKEKVLALHAKWVPLLGLEYWTITLFFEEEDPEEDAFSYYMCSNVRWEYLEAGIHVSPRCASMSDEFIEEAFVHELVHVLLAEMRNYEDDFRHEERVATMLTRAFLWVRGAK